MIVVRERHDFCSGYHAAADSRGCRPHRENGRQSRGESTLFRKVAAPNIVVGCCGLLCHFVRAAASVSVWPLPACEVHSFDHCRISCFGCCRQGLGFRSSTFAVSKGTFEMSSLELDFATGGMPRFQLRLTLDVKGA